MDFSSILNHDPASIEAKIAEFKSGFNSVFIVLNLFLSFHNLSIILS